MSECIVFPDWYTDTLLSALDLTIDETVSPAWLDALGQFNRGWVKRDDDLSGYSDVALNMRAYASFYMTINMPKLWFLLDRIAPVLRRQFADSANLRILDLGCGPGTFSWAWWLWQQQHDAVHGGDQLDFIGVDQGSEALATGDALHAAFAPHGSPMTWDAQHGDWRQALGSPADVAIFGNVLTESEANCDWIDEIAAPVVIVLEPGTSRDFQRLRPVRDAFRAAGWSIAFPCVCDAACPMPADNWCHFHINRFSLPYIQRICNRAGRLNPRHHFTAFVFLRTPQAADAHQWRVLSRLRKAGRSGIRYLCNGKAIPEVVLNRKARTDDNRPFLEADAGDLLHISNDQQLASQKRLTAKHHIQNLSQS